MELLGKGMVSAEEFALIKGKVMAELCYAASS